jgi:hypothetical protein
MQGFGYRVKPERPYMDSSSFASNRFVAAGSTAYVYPASQLAYAYAGP